MRKLLYIREDSQFFEKLLDFKGVYNIDYTNLVSIDNLSVNEKYIYVKYFQGHVWSDMKAHLSEYDNLVWKKQKEYDIKILYVSDNESGLTESLNMVESIIIEGGGDLNNSVLINNNRWNGKLSTSNNKIQTNSLERIIWEGAKCVVQSNVNFDNDSKKKIFQCYNRAVNAYRTCVIVDLIKYEMVDETDWSHLRRPDYLDSTNSSAGSQTPTTQYERITGNTFESIKPIYEKLVSTYPKKSEFEMDYEFENENGVIDYNIYYQKNPYKFSYINIVNESKFDEFDTKHMHITEKTLLPFYYFQLPLFFANSHHVKFVEENYKLDVFRDFINHDYDLETNYQKRYNMIFDEIKRLYKMKNEISKFYVENRLRFEQNHEVIRELVNLENADANKIKKYFLNLI
tara:strand:+ start:213 stop:1415 length:1203 start_codon:yes stop_codon:yes gene_type:complete